MTEIKTGLFVFVDEFFDDFVWFSHEEIFCLGNAVNPKGVYGVDHNAYRKQLCLN